MLLADLAGAGETHTGAMDTTRDTLRSPEWLEHAAQIGRRDANPMVRDPHDGSSRK